MIYVLWLFEGLPSPGVYYLFGLPLSVAAIVVAQCRLARLGSDRRSRRLAWALWAGVVLAPAFLPLGYSTGGALLLGAILLTSWLASDGARVWQEAESYRRLPQAVWIARWAAGFSLLWFLGRLWPGHLLGRLWPGPDASGLERVLIWVAWGLVFLFAKRGWTRACSPPALRKRVLWGLGAVWVAPCAVASLLVLGALAPVLVGPTLASLGVARFFLAPATLLAAPFCHAAGARVPRRVIVSAMLVLAVPLDLEVLGEDACLGCSIGEVIEIGELLEATEFSRHDEFRESLQGPFVVMAEDHCYLSLFDLSKGELRWWDRRNWFGVDYFAWRRSPSSSIFPGAR